MLEQRSTMPSKIRDFSQHIHDCCFLIRFQGNLATVSHSFQVSCALLNHPVKNCTPSVAPRVQKPCGWHEQSKPKSFLIPFLVSHEAVVITHLFRVLVLFDCSWKFSSSVSRVAGLCSNTVSALPSIWKMCPLMLLPFLQCWHHYPALSSSHWSALFCWFLLIIHHILIHLLLDNWTNIRRIVTLMCLQARS